VKTLSGCEHRLRPAYDAAGGPPKRFRVAGPLLDKADSDLEVKTIAHLDKQEATAVCIDGYENIKHDALTQVGTSDSRTFVSSIHVCLILLCIYKKHI
jgi:hypothetical protein